MLARITRVVKTSCSHSGLWSWSGERYLRFEKLEYLFLFQCCQIDFRDVLDRYLQVFLPSSYHTALNVFANIKKFLTSSYQFKKMSPSCLLIQKSSCQLKKFQTRFLPIQKFLPSSCQLKKNLPSFCQFKKFLAKSKKFTPSSRRHWPQVYPGCAQRRATPLMIE